MSIIKDQPRLRLARMARHRANAESIRQKAEAMRDPQMRQHLLTLANQFESMAESIDCMPDSKPVRRDTTQRGPQLQRQSDDDFEVRRAKATSTTPEIANETRLFDLNIEKILEAWDNTHAVRELISNALDEQELTGTAEITVRKDGNQTWIIRDYGRGLRYDHFTQNESPEKLKNSGRVIGKFGVGLKDALATLHRNGVSVEIESAHCIITLAQRGKHGFGDVVTLHAVVAPARDKKFVGTVVRLKGLADREMNTAKGLFLRFLGDKVIEQTRVGRILEKKGRTARIYIAGLLVAEEENFAFSYDITSLTEPMKKALNRERSNVGRTAYAERVKSMLLQTRSEIVGKVLARQLVELEHGMGSDEVHWKDVAVHGCKILNASGRYLFVTTSQIMSNGNAIGTQRTTASGL